MSASGALRDANGVPIVLGGEVGKGGEGAVFDVQGRVDSVAKLYFEPPSRELAAKLAAMVDRVESKVVDVAAWPTSTLHERSGALVGFIMPKVAGYRPVFQLYGPKLRLREFPRADWRFLVAAAANVARAFSVIHGAGHVVGDVNHGNLVVSQDATVRMIDCDSFQFTAGGKRWLCPVGVSTHQPPEMQGLGTYDSVVRTTNHDAFGLAVIVFQLLCMARHPFSGRPSGPGEAPSIEDAIASSSYAYSRDQARVRLSPPVGSLPIEALGADVQAMFELAFSPTVTRGGRPTASQWTSALAKLGRDLRQCRAEQGHWHLSSLKGCPWCDVEAKSGVALFPAVFVGNKTATSGILVLWQQITALPDPGPTPPLPLPDAVSATACPEAAALGARRRRRRLFAVSVAVIGWLVAFGMLRPALLVVPLLVTTVVALALFFWPDATAARPYRTAAMTARRDWRHVEASWRAQRQGPSFSDVRAALNASKQRHDELPNERARRLQRLWEARQQSQLAEHLDRFQLASAKIAGIGKAKIATLQAHQIYTAVDIDPARIHALVIPGFGPATKGKLVEWRRDCERRFRFDAARGVAQVDIAALERDLAGKSAKIERELTSGLAQLRKIVADIERHRRALEAQAAELLPRLAQANADARAIGA